MAKLRKRRALKRIKKRRPLLPEKPDEEMTEPDEFSDDMALGPGEPKSSD